MRMTFAAILCFTAKKTNVGILILTFLCPMISVATAQPMVRHQAFHGGSSERR
jgi:hypothetical protein